MATRFFWDRGRIADPTSAEIRIGFRFVSDKPSRCGQNAFDLGHKVFIIDRLAQAVAIVCRDPEIVQKMANLSLEAVGGTPEQLAAAIAADLPVYREAVIAAGLERK